MLYEGIAPLLVVLIFTVGYLAIIFEYNIKVNKTASALLMAVLTWMMVFVFRGIETTALGEHLAQVSQVIFFLVGAMALVELIDSHQGFTVITDLICTNSKKKLLWLLGFLTFFLSAILDNLTTTIVMVSLLRKLVHDKKDRMLLGAMVVLAANAGGAWTPIGDVTTTMLWINGNITTLSVMKNLFFPSLFSCIAALLLLGRELKGVHPHIVEKAHTHKTPVEPGAKLVFFAGVGALVFVPIFKACTGLPPYMGMLIALGALWLLTDVLHGDCETRKHLRVPHVLTRIDISGVLFFLGILLCIGSLEVLGLLQHLANSLQAIFGNLSIIATIIGLISAVIDNVPLVAAGMGMYDLATYPPDSFLWQMLAYCAGTGGSILVIGSAAGVALMGMEKVDFLWYCRKVSWIALLAYFVGIGVFFVQEAMLGLG